MVRLRLSKSAWFLVAVVCTMAGCERTEPIPEKDTANIMSESNSLVQLQKTTTQVTVSPIVTAARSQIGKTIIYDSGYTKLAYPGGDVPIEKGVCTDVVIRALRAALKMDLQKLVHEDMTAAFSKYPDLWGLKKPDSNIDHRRVPNLRTYFERQGFSIAVTKDKKDYLPGDFVTCTVGQNLPHIMVISDRKGRDDLPLVIHNIGSGVKEEDRLFEFPITGHYRIKEKSRTR